MIKGGQRRGVGNFFSEAVFQFINVPAFLFCGGIMFEHVFFTSNHCEWLGLIIRGLFCAMSMMLIFQAAFL